MENSGDERLVVQLPLSEATDFDELIDIENTLTLAFLKDRAGAVDGHALGKRSFNIFVVPRAGPDTVIDRIKKSLAESGVLDEALIGRRTSAREPYAVVWPDGYRGKLEL